MSKRERERDRTKYSVYTELISVVLIGVLAGLALQGVSQSEASDLESSDFTTQIATLPTTDSIEPILEPNNLNDKFRHPDYFEFVSCEDIESHLRVVATINTPTPFVTSTPQPQEDEMLPIILPTSTPDSQLDEVLQRHENLIESIDAEIENPALAILANSVGRLDLYSTTEASYSTVTMIQSGLYLASNHTIEEPLANITDAYISYFDHNTGQIITNNQVSIAGCLAIIAHYLVDSVEHVAPIASLINTQNESNPNLVPYEGGLGGPCNFDGQQITFGFSVGVYPSMLELTNPLDAAFSHESENGTETSPIHYKGSIYGGSSGSPVMEYISDETSPTGYTLANICGVLNYSAGDHGELIGINQLPSKSQLNTIIDLFQSPR